MSTHQKFLFLFRTIILKKDSFMFWNQICMSMLYTNRTEEKMWTYDVNVWKVMSMKNLGVVFILMLILPKLEIKFKNINHNCKITTPLTWLSSYKTSIFFSKKKKKTFKIPYFFLLQRKLLILSIVYATNPRIHYEVGTYILQSTWILNVWNT